MKRINELNIKINRAVITRVSVELDFETNKPSWTISGKLVTQQGIAISDFCFSSDSWQDKNKIEVPSLADLSARGLFEIFTPVIMEKLGNMFKALPAPKK